MSPFVSACSPERSNQTHSSWAGPGSDVQGRSQIFHFIFIALGHSSNLHSRFPNNPIIQKAPSSVVVQLWPVPFFDSSGWSETQQWIYLRRKWESCHFSSHNIILRKWTSQWKHQHLNRVEREQNPSCYRPWFQMWLKDFQASLASDYQRRSYFLLWSKVKWP